MSQYCRQAADGYDAEDSERLLEQVRRVITVPMGVKLPPYSIRPITRRWRGSSSVWAWNFCRSSIQSAMASSSIPNENRWSLNQRGDSGIGRRNDQAGRLGQCARILEALRGAIPIIGVGGVMTRNGRVRASALRRIGGADRDGARGRRPRSI